MGPVILLAAALAGLPPMPPAMPDTARVSFAWDASPSAGVVEYRVYQGVKPGTYTNKVSAGYGTGLTLELSRRVTNFLAVVAVDGTGLESDFSNEIAWPAPWVQPETVVVVEFQESEDLENWASLAGSLVLTNPSGNKFWRVTIRRE